MSNLQIFNNPDFGKIRGIEINGEGWLVGKDVAAMLGYKDTDQAIRNHVDDEDKLTRNFNGSGQNREMTIINESGLYALILSSKLPRAKEFKRWVTSEVLPSIRKTGSYSLPKNPHEKVMEINAAIIDIGAVAESMENIFGVKRPMALSKATAVVEKTYRLNLPELKELLPPADYETGNLTATKIAEIVGLSSARAVNKALFELGLITKSQSGKGYDLTENGRNFGELIPYTAPNGHSGYQLLWNEKIIPLFSK